ncbi:MAG: YafY family transcriptional regulator [Caulobacter sp.]|nr:YafY family transcriptional regulator [Caulobacter sp.]
MRYDKTTKVLELAKTLGGSAEGLTLDEMAQLLGVGRRTAERMRDAVWTVFPQMEAVEDPPRRRFRIPSGLDSVFLTPSAEELAALHTAAELLQTNRAESRAAALNSLERKLMAAMRSGARRKLAPDLEALSQAEINAPQAGPMAFEDERVLGPIRSAIKSLKGLSFRYQGGSNPGRRRDVTPFGVIYGRINYLIASEGDSLEPRTFRLDRLLEVAVTEKAAAPPASFSLQAFAEESFGIFHDPIQDVVLQILPGDFGADDARQWRFHPSQTIEDQPDGSVIVRFRSGGMRELAWHLFSWRDKVRIIGPQALRDTMHQEMAAAIAAHGAPAT